MRRSKFNFFLLYKSKNIKFWESNPKNIWKNKMNEKKTTWSGNNQKLAVEAAQKRKTKQKQQQGRAGWQVYSKSANRLPDTSNSFRM